VLTHGITGDHTMFDKQVEYFKDHYSLITWDMPKHGESKPYSVYSYEHNANVLIDILNTEDIEFASFAGISNGGYTIQELTHRYPERVNHLIAIDTTPFGLKYYGFFDRIKYSLFASSIKFFPEKKLRHLMATNSSQSDYGYQVMRSIQDKLTKKEIAELVKLAYSNLMKENKDVDFKRPVLILLGEHDTALSVDQYSVRWSKDTGYPLKMIKNAGHFSIADNPEEANSVIHEFLINSN
jgi:pimeloyl-ACP methyl ester carboxylesterase